MPKLKHLIITAAILIVIGAIGALLTYRTSSAGEVINKTEVIQNTELTEIEVKTDNATIEIAPTTDNFITVDLTAKENNFNKYKFNILEDTDTLTVELKEKNTRFFHFSFDFSAPALTIYLPNKQYEQLKVSSVNGKATIEHIMATNLHAKNANGRIEIENVNTKTTAVSSQNGKIIMENVEGEIKGTVVNGNITLITDHLDRAIDLQSVNGKIYIQSAKEPTNATLEVNVKNGKVDVFGDDSRSRVFGSGEHPITLETVNGSVKVEK